MDGACEQPSANGSAPAATAGGARDGRSMRMMGTPACAKVRLADPDHVLDLLRYLREREYIAYVVDDLQTIEVIGSQECGAEEAVAIRALLDAWLANRRDVVAELESVAP
jgi:hypothetical protein